MDTKEMKEDKKIHVDETSKAHSTNKILVASLTVMTIAVVVMAILGTVYMITLNHDKLHQKRSYQVRHDDNDRYVVEDRKGQVEVIKNKDSNNHMTSMIALDYKARMISIFMPRDEKCFLIGGIAEEIGSFEDDIPINVSTNDEDLNNSTYDIKYSVCDPNPVARTSLVADDISPHCTNTNTVWLERTAPPPTRKKRFLRRVRVRVGVRVRIRARVRFG